MENVGCDRSETGNGPRLPRSAHQTPASGLQLLQCCTRTPAADGLRVSATNHKASPIPRGVHLKRARTTVASFTIFFSTRSNDDTRQRLAHPLTHPQSASAIRRRTAASRQTTAVALRSMFPASVASAVFLEESVAANAWLWALGRRTACACPARGKHQPAHQLRLVATYCVVWCTCTTLMSWASTSLRRLRTLCRAASAVRSASGNHSRPRNQPAPFLLSAIASSSAAGKETTPN